MRRFAAGILTVLLSPFVLAQELPKAILHTTAGDITIELYSDRAPVTVENFIGLSKGTKTYTDPRTGKATTGKPFYNGIGFHRIVDGFMIQGGDPLGNGMGGPGYQFKNEDSDLSFDKAGRVAMANRGRDTNGSQFFITVAPVQRLDGGYTIFGQVVDGMDVVTKISKMPTNGDQAVDPVKINSVDIKLPGESAAATTTATAVKAPNTTETAN